MARIGTARCGWAGFGRVAWGQRGKPHQFRGKDGPGQVRSGQAWNGKVRGWASPSRNARQFSGFAWHARDGSGSDRLDLASIGKVPAGRPGK